PPALEMDGQFRGDLPRLRAITSLLPRANALMQPHAPPCWHPLVHALLIHRVDETIPRCHRPVWPYHGPPRLQKLLPAGQGGTPVLDVARLAVDARGHRRRPELYPHPAPAPTRPFHLPLVPSTDLPELLPDQGPRPPRHPPGHSFQPLRHRPAGVLLQHALPHHGVYNTDHEQRIAPCAPLDKPGQPLRQRPPREPRR